MQSKGDGIFWLWVVINGCFVMAVPVLLITAAMRHILPPENALIGLLELLLAPIWVFLALGEAPSVWTLVGGILLLITLAWHEYVRTLHTMHFHTHTHTPFHIVQFIIQFITRVSRDKFNPIFVPPLCSRARSDNVRVILQVTKC